MAQSAYTGIQGSGKSYEVVRGVILPNVAKGRRVVTNIAGLKDADISDYCVNSIGADRDALGTIVHITNDDVTLPNFFPKEGQDNSACIVQSGDVIILDECWRWYVTGEKLPEGHLTFFRMHRHFIHPESGVSCDIVLIVQDINDLQRKIKATIEKNFLMQKHTDLGLMNRYVVNIYSGNRQTKSALIQTFQETYKPEIYNLYSSYSQATTNAAPKEQAADARGNFLKNWRIRILMPLAVLMLIAAVWNVYKFFNPSKEKKPELVASSSVPAPSAPSAEAVAVAGASDKPKSDVSETWRLVGYVNSESGLLAILENAAGRVRYVEPPAWRFAADLQLALPNGDVVTRWSGPVRTKQ